MTATMAWPRGYDEPQPRMGFFTDTSICIGCKACEVACKEWNGVPESSLLLSGESYDNTGRLDADNWRHVAFVEQRLPVSGRNKASGVLKAEPRASIGIQPGSPNGQAGGGEFRWLMSSDVCKHCTRAACLEVCPTGSLFRTEFGTVVVQEDICNGCGYCVPACPFGVLNQRQPDGRVWKCTLCYDRLKGGFEPACSQACPTDSIQFGRLDELRRRADRRLATLVEMGIPGAQLYGADTTDGVDGMGAFFLLLDDPEVYGLPPDPVVTTRDVAGMWKVAAGAAVTLAGAVAAVFLGGGR